MTDFATRYAAAMADAEARFRPLADELERLLEVKTSVDQTGGMVMCLRVPVGRELDALGRTRRWAWFSELGALGQLGVGLYSADAWGEASDEGEFIEHPTLDEPDSWDDWCDRPELAREVARWAAGHIVAFASGDLAK